MPEATPGFPAFKEWAPIVGALARGEQSLILRKGGIAEGRGGFAAKHTRFWLFPTAFHAEPGKLKPAVSLDASLPADGSIPLQWVAEVVDHRFLSEWAEIQALAPYHGWTEATIRERFLWSTPAGLHALTVRVFGLPEPLWLSPSPRWGGCKSWLDVPQTPSLELLKPVLSDADFERQRAPGQS